MFYPARGIPEDPATRSAAGPLALHLARHGRIGFGQEIEIRQGVEIGRPSVLYAVATGSRERVESVEVGRRRAMVRRARMNGRRWALEGGVGRAASRRRDARCAFSSRDLSRSVASARASSRERVMATPCPEGRTHPSRACVPSTSRVPMAMQYTDRYVYYEL